MIVDKIMCVIFCVIKNLYVTMSLIKAIACKVVDIPPKEIMAQDNIVFVLILRLKEERDKQPFVISKNPLIIAFATFSSIPIFENI